MGNQDTTLKETTNFWTTGIVILALIALHFARVQCATRPYERHLMLLFDYHKVARKDTQPLLKSDAALETPDGHSLGIPPGDVSKEVSGQHDMPLYEDDYLVVLSKPTVSIKPKTHVEIRQYGLKSGTTHFTGKTAAQWLFADIIYILQVYVTYKRLYESRLAIPLGLLDRVLSAVDLMPTMGVVAVSTMLFVHEATTLQKDYADTARATRAWLLSILGLSILGGSVCLLYFFVTSV